MKKDYQGPLSGYLFQEDQEIGYASMFERDLLVKNGRKSERRRGLLVEKRNMTDIYMPYPAAAAKRM